jgi:hypothetical protein
MSRAMSMRTYSITDDDGVVLVAVTPLARVAQLSYPKTVLAAMKAGRAVAFETGGEGEYEVRVHAKAATAMKKQQLRGPFRVELGKGDRLIACSYADWTSGHDDGKPLDLPPGGYDVAVAMTGDDEPSFDVYVTKAKTTGTAKVPRALPSFAPTNPLDVDESGRTAFGTAERIASGRPTIPTEPRKPLTPERRASAERWARVALHRYRSCGRRGAAAVAQVEAMMAKYDLVDGPID